MIVQDIDFLPESYHTKRLLGRKKLWRRVILVAFLLIIGTSTLQQRFQQHKRERNRDRIQQRAANLIAQLDDAEELQRQIDLADAKANVLTLLRIQVPPTRILAAVTSNLPEFVTLTELHTTYETLASPNVPTRKRPPNRAVQKDDDQPGVIVDFEQLKKQRQETALYVSLKGVAPNDIVVARYLALLQESHVFDEALLEITEGNVFQGYQLRRFGVRLKVSRLENRKRTPSKTMPPSSPVPEPPFAKSQRRKTFAANGFGKPAATAERTIR